MAVRTWLLLFVEGYRRGIIYFHKSGGHIAISLVD